MLNKMEYRIVYEAVGTVGGESTQFSYYLGKGLNQGDMKENMVEGKDCSAELEWSERGLSRKS